MKITANQVTMARILLLPVPCALVLWGTDLGLLAALILGAILGATDAVDGYMARRDGPTVLGGLLDPAADKLFVAAFILPLTAQGYCPPWVAGGIFFRELLITSLRTSMAMRKAKLTTSQLGKLKTVVQMGGLGVFYFTAFVPETVMLVAHALGAGGFAVYWLGHVAIRRRLPAYWVNGATPLWLLVAAAVFWLGREQAIFVLFVTMLVLTWVSGLDYLSGAWKVLAREGWRAHDWVRIVSSVLHSTAIGVVTWLAPAAVVPLLVGFAGELALGGIDNVVAAERGLATRYSGLVTALFAAATATLALVFRDGPELWVVLAASAQALASLWVALRAYGRDRPLFA